MSDIYEKLKAVNELKHRGSTPEERQSAKEKLDQLSIKYNVSIEELDKQRVDGDLHWYGFKVRDLMEFHILVQCIWYITERVVESIKDEPGLRMAFQLSEREVKDCTMAINNYLSVWREDYQIILQAFVMKHKLFGPSSPKSETKDNPSQDKDSLIASRRRTARIMAIMDELTPSLWTKPPKNYAKLN